MRRRIKIYGERNTGTNYLGKLVQRNLRAKELPGVLPPVVRRVQRAAPRFHGIRGSYFALTHRRNLGWKHAAVDAATIRHGRRAMNTGVCFVSLTKNPYAWLVSLHRRPYHQYEDSIPDFAEFLTLPWRPQAADRLTGELCSPIELWNRKNASYLRLRELGGLNLKSEELVSDPRSTIERIRLHFELERLAPDFSNEERSTKSDGKSSADFRDYYAKQEWRDMYTDRTLAIVNEALDPGLMSEFGYAFLRSTTTG